MKTQAPPSRSSVGGMTGFILTMVIILCLGLIGGAGYVKFQLAQSESALASPDSATGTDTDALDKLRRALGYSGFVGAAQDYAATHEASKLPDMRANLKLANDALSALPEKTPIEARRDTQAIIATFDAAMKKAEKAASDNASSFSILDLAPLYATLPVLDARLNMINTGSRIAAQNETEMWSLILTLITWSSLIIACAMTVVVYLTLLGRQSVPLRALAQSVRNLSSGDLRTSIWGMERQDQIGELARAIDSARYQFSQIPDMSLMSDKGPLRLRFEGNTKSVFEAMINAISKDSEQVRAHTSTLTESISKQQEVVTLLSSRVEAVLHNVEKRGMDGDKQVRDILNKVLNSAEGLKNAQEHAADQLNRILPFLQERAQGMAEITQIAGKQIATSLQSLTLSERELKSSAESSKDAISKLATTADSLGDRLFGAVNLLQASGKVLSETTETAGSRLNEAVEQLKKGMSGNPAFGTAPSPEDIMEIMKAASTNIAPRIESAIAALEAAQNRLEERLNDTTNSAKIQVDMIASSTNQLNEIGAKLEQHISQLASPTSSGSDDESLKQIAALAGQLDRMTEKLSILDQIAEATAPRATPEPVMEPAAEPAYVAALQDSIRGGVEATVKNIEELRTQLAAMASSAKSEVAPDDMLTQMREHWRNMAGQIEATRTNLEMVINHQIGEIENRIASIGGVASATGDVTDMQKVMEQQTLILSELVATMGVLDAHMQDIRQQVALNRRAS